MGLTAEQAAVVKGMLARGDKQHHIAAEFDQNSGRIADIATGKKFPEVQPAPRHRLPPPHTPRFINPNDPLERQIEMLLQLIKNPPQDSRVVTFSPQLAEWVLRERNGANRKFKAARIERYSEAMAQGRWHLTGETIIFGKEHGMLLDGQNRLKACVKSGKPFRTHVVFGISDAVFTVINTAKARTPSDMFQKQAVPYPSVIAPAVRWLMIYAEGDATKRPSYSNDEMWAFYERNVDHDLLTRVAKETSLASKTFPRGSLAAHLYLFEKKHAATKRRLVDDLTNHLRGAKKLTVAVLKKRKENMGRINDVWLNAMLVKTWNAYRKNENVTAETLKWNDEKQEYPTIA